MDTHPKVLHASQCMDFEVCKDLDVAQIPMLGTDFEIICISQFAC